MLIVDVAAPATVTTLASYSVPGASSIVDANGSYAYVVDSQTLNVVQVSNPLAPRLIGQAGDQSYADDMEVVGHYAYLISGSLQIVDVANPAAPAKLGSTDSMNGQAIDVSGDYAYVTEYNEGLHIVDIANPTNPTEVGFYATPGGAYDVTVSGRYA